MQSFSQIYSMSFLKQNKKRGIWRPDWHLQRVLYTVLVLPESKKMTQQIRLADKAAITSCSRLGSNSSVEELEILHASTKPRASRHRLPGGQNGYKAKDIMPSIAWRREAGTKPRTSCHRSPWGERGHKAKDITPSTAWRREGAQSQGHHAINRLEERRGTKPRTSHHRSAGGERGHKAKDITPSIGWRREAVSYTHLTLPTRRTV